MRSFILFFFGIIIFSGCENKNTVEIIPSYDSIYLTSVKVDRQPQLIEGDAKQLIIDIQNEMNRSSEEKINLEYKFFLNEKGKVEKILAVKTDGKDYSEIIASEVGGWKFEPALKNGKAVKSQYKWELNIPPEKSIDATEYKVSTDTMPSPVGGMKSLQQNIIYPENAKQKGIEGKVIVQVYIDETGQVVKTTVLKSAGDELDEAAVTALQKTRFTPGKENGKPVKVKVVIPIVFKLS